jgi:Uma2 family endonuclease
MTIVDEHGVEFEQGVRPHRFTADEYMEMARMGLFLDKRVELIDGEILDMSPQQPPHALAISRCFWLARKAYDDPTRFFVLTQATLRLGEDRPEPDLYVLPCAEGVDASKFPPPLWILEIADTTYPFDAGDKAAMYARHGIEEYFILDLKRRRLLVHRDPVEADGVWPYDFKETLGEDDQFRPTRGPAVEWAVKAMLP